jgi:hypothetical protein
MQRSNVRMQNDIIISKVANGWRVQMPMRIPEPPDFSRDISQSLEPLIPLFKNLMKIRDEDPLLAELQKQNELESEPESDPDPVQMPDPIIGIDRSEYVFPSFGQVLDFLEEELGEA